MSTDIEAALAHQVVLPVLRTDSAAQAVTRSFSLIEAGMSLVELTATIPDWSTALREVCERSPGTIVGLGTVTDQTTARSAIEAGASFLVSPWPSAEVREVARAADVLFIEGAFSPGEVAAVAERGIVKVFPAHVVGPEYLRGIGQLLPDATLVPSGGIPLEDVPMWVDAGAFAVGVGSDLFSGDLPGRLADVRSRLKNKQEA